MEESSNSDSKKVHRERKSGRKANKKKAKSQHVQELTARERNPKAFAFHSVVKAQRKVARTADLKSKKHHIPVVNRAPLEPPPALVAVVGGCKVGKSTLIQSLIKHYTRQKLTSINGPVTIISGKKHRLTFIEVNNDINSMVDIAKIADVVLMLIDISLGIEMEVFEFLEICRAYGMPRVMGILNHLDLMKDNKMLRKKKKDLIHRFQVELYPGAKLFYLSGIIHGGYFKNEVSNLARFISVLKFRPLHFRSTHPYVLVDRVEDITNVETVRKNPVCDRSVVLYGYVRGIPLQANQLVHIPGVGEYHIKEISILDDPCPLPNALKKRSLNAKERLMYAPMSGVSGVVYDKDAIYIDLGGSHHGRTDPAEVELADDERDIMKSLLHLQKTADEKTAESQFKLFSHSRPVSNYDVINDDDVISDDDDINDDNDVINDEEDSDSESYDSEQENGTSSQLQFEMFTDAEGNVRRRAVLDQESDFRFMNESGDDEEGIGENDDKDDEQEGIDKNGPKVKRRKCQTMGDFEDMKIPGFEKSLSISNKSYINFIQNAIYGNVPAREQQEDVQLGISDSDSENDEDDLFRRPTQLSTSRTLPQPLNLSSLTDPNGLDSSKFGRSFKDWTDPEVLSSIRDCFVTGEWGEFESAEKLLKMDNEDQDLYGDFEDLETGDKFVSKNQQEKINETDGNKEEERKKRKSEMTAQERRLEKKRKLKELFDAEFDDKGKGDMFESLKQEMNDQAELNRKQFESLDDETRIRYEGYRAGLYVRMEFEAMNCELMTNFEASYPLIVGGLLDSEINMGYVRARLKVHRWFPRILKNKDPLYLSIGWRRFQTMMFYAKREDNFRVRSLKYARKYLHVEVLFWGPLSETSSGFVAFQDVNNKTSDFSIAATGVVLEGDKSTKLVKKLKLIGYPQKIFQKTAFIKDMFHSDTEVTKFEGTQIKTQSGIRGIIKKFIGTEGLFRATFEDQIKMSDVVILITWVSLEIPKFCSVVKNLLLPIGNKNQWRGLKTNAQVKRENNVKNLPNPDSFYTEIKERREHVKVPVKVPKALQQALPYRFKRKHKEPGKKKPRIVVVKDKQEVKMETFMSQLRSMMNEKTSVERQKMKEQRREFKKSIIEREGVRKMRERRVKAFACKRKSSRKSKSIT